MRYEKRGRCNKLVPKTGAHFHFHPQLLTYFHRKADSSTFETPLVRKSENVGNMSVSEQFHVGSYIIFTCFLTKAPFFSDSCDVHFLALVLSTVI